MAKPIVIEMPGAPVIPIIYEDRVALVIDKPPGWMLAPLEWENTGRNLQLAIESSVRGGDFWARSRNIKFLRYVHRLDADTSGVLLFGKSPGAVSTLSRLFETRRLEKTYLAVVRGVPKEAEWVCRLAIGPDPIRPDRMKTRPDGKDAETHFKVLRASADTALVQARPLTGRTHQIRVHLAVAGLPVVGDRLYGPNETNEQASRRSFSKGTESTGGFVLGLRAVELSYFCPFQKRLIKIRAPDAGFAAKFGFA